MSIATSCICGKCAYFCDGREGCMHNQSNPQEVPQVKSVDVAIERIKAATKIIKDESDLLRQADSTYTSWDHQHTDVKHLIIGAMLDFSNAETAPLNDRIAELETERDKYKEALEEINGLDARSDDRPELYDATQIAYKALIKAEQTLNSKEVGND